MMGGASSRRGLWLDPRTKILLLLFCILSAMMAPSLFYELGLVVLIGLLGVCFGKWKYAWKGVLFYALIVLLTLWIMDTMTGMLATKGHPKRRSAGVHQVILSHIEEHSKKPDEARRRIVELMGDLPRIELFARQKADGWDAWGNEVACDIALTGGEPNVG